MLDNKNNIGDRFQEIWSSAEKEKFQGVTISQEQYNNEVKDSQEAVDRLINMVCTSRQWKSCSLKSVDGPKDGMMRLVFEKFVESDFVFKK